MLKRIIFCLCLTGLVQVSLPLTGNATQTATTLLGDVDHLPQHVLNQVFRVAGNYYQFSWTDAASAYQRGTLLIWEVPGPNGERAVMMDLDGNCLLLVVADLL